MFVFKTGKLIPEYIINFPTKRHWKNKSKLIDISVGLKDLIAKIQTLGIKSVAIPPLGCGFGGLSWPDVKNEMIKAFSNFENVNFYVFEPQAHFSSEMPPVQKSLTFTQPLILKVFSTYLHFADAYEMTFVEAHMLCYLTQELGVDLKLCFEQWRYGPYASNLRFILNDMENTWIKGYNDGNCRPFDYFHMLNKAYDIDLIEFYENIESIICKLFRVVEGFETAVGLELLGTVHWLARHEHIDASIVSIEKALGSWCGKPEWSARKKKLFPPRMLALALARLRSTGMTAAPVFPPAAAPAEAKGAAVPATAAPWR